MKNKVLVFACLALCAMPVIWLCAAYASAPTLDSRGRDYTFSFSCPAGSYASGYGESEVFYPGSDINVKLWCTDVNLGGAQARINMNLYRNGECLNWQDDRAELCSSWGPWPVVTTDQLKMRITVSCQNGPAGMVRATATCLNAVWVHPRCLQPDTTPY